MNQEINGFTINGNFYPKDELISFCREEISANKNTDWKLDVYRFILDFLDDADFISQQTSGSTGTPKTVQLSKQAMLNSAKMTCEFFHLKKEQVAVLCLPIKYIAGKMMVVRALLAGLNLVLIEPAGTPDFSEIERVDFCAMVPMQALNLLEQSEWPEIKTLILGGAETGIGLAEKLQKVKTEVFETFGMAETTSHIALKRINGKNPEQFFTTLPGIKISLDERDCLEIEVPFLQNKIITNDIIELISENNFRLIGRFDTIINSGGIKIQPEILEKHMEEILQMPCAISGSPNELLGQEIVLIVETIESLNSSQIIEKLAPFFDRKMLPKAVVFVQTLPRNNSFKVDRHALKKLI